MYSKNKYCKNSKNQNNNFRIVYTDLFKCSTYFAKLNFLNMTIVMVEISIKKMEINILNSFFTEMFVSLCVYKLIYIYILYIHSIERERERESCSVNRCSNNSTCDYV